jgi:hypothetical protein
MAESLYENLTNQELLILETRIVKEYLAITATGNDLRAAHDRKVELLKVYEIMKKRGMA